MIRSKFIHAALSLAAGFSATLPAALPPQSPPRDNLYRETEKANDRAAGRTTDPYNWELNRIRESQDPRPIDSATELRRLDEEQQHYRVLQQQNQTVGPQSPIVSPLRESPDLYTYDPPTTRPIQTQNPQFQKALNRESLVNQIQQLVNARERLMQSIPATLSPAAQEQQRAQIRAEFHIQLNRLLLQYNVQSPQPTTK